MEKIDLNEVKRLSRILSEKEKPESRHAKKLREVQMQMTAKDILKDVIELKEIVKKWMR